VVSVAHLNQKTLPLKEAILRSDLKAMLFIPI
jgi:hypothetical protein